MLFIMIFFSFLKQSVFTVEEKELSEERLYFKKFETKYVDEGLKFIKENLLSYGSDRSNKVLHATGSLISLVQRSTQLLW